MGSKRRRVEPAETSDPSELAELAKLAQAQNSAEITAQLEDEPEHAPEAKRPSKKVRVDSSRSLFVRSLPPTATDASLTDFFSQHFPVKHATVILDPKTKASRGYGFVTFTDADDAKDAKEKLQKQKLDGRPLILEVAEPRHRQGAAMVQATEKKQERQTTLAEARKAPKLIVRNLPWSIKTSDQLAALFRSYGKVKFADLPQNKGKLSGFGFVTIRGRKNAEAAIESVNSKVVDGRTLAVDWAVDKKQWEQQNPKDGPAAGEEDTPSEEGEEEGQSEIEKDDDEDDVKEKENDEDDDLDADLKNFMKNHMQNLEEEDSNDENSEAEDEEAGSDGRPQAPKKVTTTDNSATIFIRNLPFSTTDEQLKSHFEQFGPIRYARTVVDRATDRPAGTGFVCFVNDSDFKTCLKGAPQQQQQPLLKGKRSILQDEMADLEGKYTIEGRIVQVSQAVSKDEATRLAESGAVTRREKDKRRLYLLSEGTIPASSPLYAALSPTEVRIREQSAAQRKKLIQGNPSLHLSLTRLAIRNIPRDLAARDLKALAREAIVEFAKDVAGGKRQPLSAEEKARGGADDREAERRRREKGKGIVKQAKIVFENRQGSKVNVNASNADIEDGAARSRGYGFVEYTSHRWALMGLRWLNGHALKSSAASTGGRAGKTQRLIAEFAIENAQVVNRRKELEAKSRVGNTHEKKAEGDDDDEEVEEEEEQTVEKGKRGKRGAKGVPPKGKDFAVSKDKRQNDKKGRIGADDVEKGDADGGSRENGEEDALKQKIIARKRMVRKKKAQIRR
ncbi:RNA recognition motif-containing protein [Diatrype stigma]|uniref:RNA recognition motif-containing protein n=1 Tax=Diatrype stigma TaxID=117547 RepID=A0AAN9UY26_9PEZI